MKKHLRIVILTIATALCLAFGLSVFSACGMSSKVEKIKIGDTRERVVKVLGEPDEDTGYALGWYGGDVKKIIKRMAKIEEEFMQAMEKGDADKLNDLMQESLELEEKLSTLFFPYTVVMLDADGLVTEVSYDSVYNTVGASAEKTVKKTKVEGTFHATIRDYGSLGSWFKFSEEEEGADEGKEVDEEAAHQVKIYYTDGSYRSYARTDLKLIITLPTFSGYVSWSDSLGEYEATCKVKVNHINKIEKNSVATIKDISATWQFTALKAGSYDKLPELELRIMPSDIIAGGRIAWPITDSSTITPSIPSSIREQILSVTIEGDSWSNVTIADSVFASCPRLASVAISNGITIIERSAFNGCRKLASITIPNSVRKIGRTVFSFCESLTTITYQGTMTEWKAIEKDREWRNYSAIESVVCTDGTLTGDEIDYNS